MKKIFFVVFLLCVGIFSLQAVSQVDADYTSMRIPPIGDNPDNYRTDCYGLTTSENLSVQVKKNQVDLASTSSNACTFTMDVRARGEWESVGAHEDSPPFGWRGQPVWNPITFRSDYGVVAGGFSGFSVTCTDPGYSLPNALPSYVELVKEEDLFATDPAVASGKRYYFRLKSDAPQTGTFNILAQASYSCQLDADIGSIWGRVIMQTIQPGRNYYSYCAGAEVIDKSSHQTSFNYRISLENGCLASPPPPSPTVTPQPPASSSCEPITLSGELKTGGTITLTATKRGSESPGAGTFHVTKDANELTTSPLIGPTVTTALDPSTNQNVNVYTTRWPYTLTNSGTYTISLEYSPAVQQIENTNHPFTFSSFFKFMTNSWKSLGKKETNLQKTTIAKKEPKPNVLSATSQRSIQLYQFQLTPTPASAIISRTCAEIKFTVAQ